MFGHRRRPARQALEPDTAECEDIDGGVRLASPRACSGCPRTRSADRYPVPGHPLVCGMASLGDPKVEHDDAIDFRHCAKRLAGLMSVQRFRARTRHTAPLPRGASRSAFLEAAGATDGGGDQIVPLPPHSMARQGVDLCDPMIDVAHDGGMSKSARREPRAQSDRHRLDRSGSRCWNTQDLSARRGALPL